MSQLLRQHVIDPEICIRCETCAEMCQQDAISYDGVNVVVDFDLCNHSMNCIAPCPTGAIDNWRMVEAPYSVDEQYGWEDLPAQASLHPDSTDAEATEDDVLRMLADAHAGAGGEATRPHSAATPSINLYSRTEPAVAEVQGNFRITDESAESDVRHIILDLGGHALPILEGQSVGIVPPGEDASGRRHFIRLYTVCSPRDGERPNHNNIALTVKRVVEARGGDTFRGIASNYLCDLKRGDRVELTGPYGSSFLMPDDPEANIIMVCTGTGAAPFRAMTERRRRNQPRGPGKLLLFFGARTRGELPYFGPLMKLPESLIHRELVFSRESGEHKEYVQDRMLACAERVAELMQSEQTHVFICGLKGMEEGVDASLQQICSDAGMDWPALRQDMLQQGRYHVETY